MVSINVLIVGQAWLEHDQLFVLLL